MTTPCEISAAYKRLGNVEAVAEEFGITQAEVSSVVDDMRLRELYRHKGGHSIYDDDKIIAALRKAAKIVGEPLTVPNYRGVASDQSLPAYETIVRHFGSFQAACKAAKIKANPPKGHSAISMEECLTALRAYHQEQQCIPTYRGYSRWAAEHGKPSGSTVRLKFSGGWGEAVREAFA